MSADDVLSAAESVYEQLPEDATDSELEEALRQVMPGLYPFADEFDRMSPDEQAAILASKWYTV